MADCSGTEWTSGRRSVTFLPQIGIDKFGSPIWSGLQEYIHQNKFQTTNKLVREIVADYGNDGQTLGLSPKPRNQQKEFKFENCQLSVALTI